MDTVKNLLNMEQFNLESKFDLTAFLKSANGGATTTSISANTSPSSTPSLTSGTATTPTTNTNVHLNFLNTPLMNPISRITLNNISPFVPIKPVYAPSGYGRQILIYDSRSYPGHRREFAYKTRFTNQSGLTTVYYRCMACRALRHKMQRVCEKEKLPAVPCIAVKNELLINDPDFPEASDHFCQPLTIEASNDKLKVSFERGYKRSRMKLEAEESALKKSNTPTMLTTPSITCEIDESTTNPISQYFWTKTESAACLLINDETAQSSSSEASKENNNCSDSTDNVQLNMETNKDEELADSDTEHMDSKPMKRTLDELLRLHNNNKHTFKPRESEREKSPSPDENLNIQDFAQKMLFDASNPNLLFQLGLNAASPNGSPFLNGSPISGNISDLHSTSLFNLAAKLRSSELLKALTKPPTKNQNGSEQSHMSEILNRYIWNSWDLPENAGNSRSAAELTCTLILSLARHVPQAAASIKQGKWARKDFMGEEVHGKTLAIVGLGRIGFEVASRMQSFGMKIVGFDPMECAKRQIRWLPLEEIWPVADYITVHVPLIEQTKNLLNKQTFGLCKKGVKIINAARGGIINEADLVEAINSGIVGGAAIDVFVEEPPTYGVLTEHPKIICTPHLGASTLEAQQRVAVEIAENIISLNNNNGIFGTLNAAALVAIVDEHKKEYVKTVTALGQTLASIAPNTKQVLVKYPAGAVGIEKALIAGCVLGLLQASDSTGLNLINAEMNAKKAGITVKTEQISGNEFILTNGSAQVTGYNSPAGPIISAINNSKIPVSIIASGTMAVSKNMSNFVAISDKLKNKLSVEYGLLGGGRLALFGPLEQDEINQLSESFSIVQFKEY